MIHCDRYPHSPSCSCLQSSGVQNSASSLRRGPLPQPPSSLRAAVKTTQHHAVHPRISAPRYRTGAYAESEKVSQCYSSCGTKAATAVTTQHSDSSMGLRTAGPAEEPPDYGPIDSQPLNKLIMARFRSKMVAALREDVPSRGYQGIVDLTRVLNAKFDNPQKTQQVTQGILQSLFPSWLLPAFQAMFSRPMPGLSCKLNAWVTALTCQWLMGPCQVNDAEGNDGSVLPRQGVKIERCRYLEETQCASICINSCKMPTQEFFSRDMGLPLTMEPNYDDFSCQFSFGRVPAPQHEDEAFSTPCFMNCPSKQPHRKLQSQCGGVQTN